MNYQVGDRIKTRRQIMVGANVYGSGSLAVIIAPSLAARGWIVQMFLDNSTAMLHEDDFFLFDNRPEPEPEQQEAPPAMGWFAALAESNIINGAEPTASIYATLEVAAAIDRLALAVDQVVRRG